MIDKFELLLDLLDIEDKHSYMKVAEKIEEKKHKKIKTFHKHGFVFELFNDFLDHKISLEDFVKIGDIEGNIDISQLSFSLENLVSDGYDLSDTLFVVSLVDIGRKFSEKEVNDIRNKLNNLNSFLFVI